MFPAGSVQLSASTGQQQTAGAQRAADTQGALQPIKRRDVSAAHAQCGLSGCPHRRWRYCLHS